MLETICFTIIGIVFFCMGFIVFHASIQTEGDRNDLLDKIEKEKNTEEEEDKPKLTKDELDKIFSEESYIHIFSYLGNHEFCKIVENKMHVLRIRDDCSIHYRIEDIDKNTLRRISKNVLKIEFCLKSHYDLWFKEYTEKLYVGDRVKIMVPSVYSKYSFVKNFLENNLIPHEHLSEGKVVNIIDKDTFPTVIVKFDNWADNIGMKYSCLEKIINEDV